MALTGTNTFTVTRDDIIKASLRTLGVIGVGETPIAEDYTNCSQALNIMIKAWAKKGLPLWVTQYLELPCVTGITQYAMGPSGGVVGAVSITSGGSGFSNSGTWVASGGTTGMVASGVYTATSGVLEEVIVVNPGSSYTSAPTITFDSGTGATVTALVAGLTISRPLRIIEAFLRQETSTTTSVAVSNAVTAIAITGAGTGFTATSGTWTTTGGGGTGATGTYVTDGSGLTSITIVAGGSGYSSTPTIVFSGAGSGATFTITRAASTVTGETITTQQDIPLIQLSRQEYDIIGSKQSSAVPNQYYYDVQLTNGQLYLYNIPQDTTRTVFLTIQRMFYDMTLGTDNFDFPQEFFQALKWGLCAELMAEYPVPRDMFPYFEQKAQYFIQESFDYEVEEASVFFSPSPLLNRSRL